MGDADRQSATRELVAALQAASVESQLEDGDGMVDPAVMFERRSRAAFQALRNARRSVTEIEARHSYRGPIFTLTLYDRKCLMGDGSVGTVSDVVACVCAWLDGRASSLIAEEFPFINGDAGVLSAIAPTLDASLRAEVGGAAPFHKLWVYGRQRACKLTVEEAGIGCAFYLGLERAAVAASVDDPKAVVSAWLVDRLPLDQLQPIVRALELTSHATLLETDPARRHWLLLREELVDPDHPLAAIRELVDALSESAIASRFYSFRYSNRLQFSASSHLDWVIDRMPYASRTEAGTYEVAGEFTREIGSAVRLVEEELTRSGIQPFFGSGAEYELRRLAESLARQGSALQPAVVQRGDSVSLVVVRDARHCEVTGTDVLFSEGRRRARARFSSVDAAARSIRRFLEYGASLDVVQTAPD